MRLGTRGDCADHRRTVVLPAEKLLRRQTQMRTLVQSGAPAVLLREGRHVVVERISERLRRTALSVLALLFMTAVVGWLLTGIAETRRFGPGGRSGGHRGFLSS
jgi:hypothetical protein